MIFIKRYIAKYDTTITNAYKSDLSNRATGSNMGESDVLEVFSIYGQADSGSQELSRVLGQLHSALKDDGILFTSNPRGSAEGWQGKRYGHYMEFESSKIFLERSGFNIIEHYYRPKGKPREEQPWLAIVSRCKKS